MKTTQLDEDQTLLTKDVDRKGGPHVLLSEKFTHAFITKGGRLECIYYSRLDTLKGYMTNCSKKKNPKNQNQGSSYVR